MAAGEAGRDDVDRRRFRRAGPAVHTCGRIGARCALRGLAWHLASGRFATLAVIEFLARRRSQRCLPLRVTASDGGGKDVVK